MTILTTPVPQAQIDAHTTVERRWHVLSIAAFTVAIVAAVLSLVAVVNSDSDAAQPSPPAVVVAPRSIDATSVQATRDAHAAERYRTVDACGRPIVAGRQACD